MSGMDRDGKSGAGAARGQGGPAADEAALRRIWRLLGKTIIARDSERAAEYVARDLGIKVVEMRFLGPDYTSVIYDNGVEIRFQTRRQYEYQVTDIYCPPLPILPRRPPVVREI